MVDYASLILAKAWTPAISVGMTLMSEKKASVHENLDFAALHPGYACFIVKTASVSDGPQCVVSIRWIERKFARGPKALEDFGHQSD